MRTIRLPITGVARKDTSTTFRLLRSAARSRNLAWTRDGDKRTCAGWRRSVPASKYKSMFYGNGKLAKGVPGIVVFGRRGRTRRCRSPDLHAERTGPYLS